MMLLRILRDAEQPGGGGSTNEPSLAEVQEAVNSNPELKESLMKGEPGVAEKEIEIKTGKESKAGTEEVKKETPESGKPEGEETPFDQKEYLKNFGLDDFESIDAALERLSGGRKEFHDHKRLTSRMDELAKTREFKTAGEFLDYLEKEGGEAPSSDNGQKGHLNSYLENTLKEYQEADKKAREEFVQRREEFERERDEWRQNPENEGVAYPRKFDAKFASRADEFNRATESLKPLFEAANKDTIDRVMQEIQPFLQVLGYTFDNVKRGELNNLWESKNEEFRKFWDDKRGRLDDIIWGKDKNIKIDGIIHDTDPYERVAGYLMGTKPELLKTFNDKVNETAAKLTEAQRKERDKQLAKRMAAGTRATKEDFIDENGNIKVPENATPEQREKISKRALKQMREAAEREAAGGY